MFLVGALFALVTIGVVVPCLIDVAVAPDLEVRGLAKQWWVLLIVFGSVLGAAAWLVLGRPRVPSRARARWSYRSGPYVSAEDALRRHPAGQAMERGLDASSSGRVLRAGADTARPAGPDDDPAFLEELARRIRRGGEADSDA
jgi:hypothetical protein